MARTKKVKAYVRLPKDYKDQWPFGKRVKEYTYEEVEVLGECSRIDSSWFSVYYLVKLKDGTTMEVADFNLYWERAY